MLGVGGRSCFLLSKRIPKQSTERSNMHLSSSKQLNLIEHKQQKTALKIMPEKV